jgi:hypothetical protein
MSLPSRLAQSLTFSFSRLKHFDSSEIEVVVSNTSKEAGEELYNKLKDFNMESGDLKVEASEGDIASFAAVAV